MAQTSPTSLHRLTFILQHQYDDHLISRVGVSFAHVRMMEVLDKSVPRSQRQVAHLLGQTEANASRQLQVMRRQGLVSIVKNQKDARQRDVRLTDKGAKKFTQSEKILSQHHRDLFKLLSEREAKAFNRATDNLLKALHSPVLKGKKTIGDNQ